MLMTQRSVKRTAVRLPNISGEPAISAILENGYTECHIDPTFLAPRLGAVYGGMKVLTDDPALAELFPYGLLPYDLYGEEYPFDYGLRERKDDERKFFFHFIPQVYREDDGRIVSQLARFFRALRDLDAKARELALTLAHDFDTIYGTSLGNDCSMVEWLGDCNCMTRALRYLKRENRFRYDAKPHVDRNAITPHWGGTQDGMRILDTTGTWRSINETAPDMVALFYGEKFAAFLRGRYGFGTLHYVKSPEREQHDRLSAVSFVHPTARACDVACLNANKKEIEAFEDAHRQ
jgi:hypothetical protein